MIADALKTLKVTSVTIDGEGVVCGKDGVSNFELLRGAAGRKGSREAFLYAFDLLELDGNDLRREPWNLRRETLASLLRKAAPGIRLSEHLDGADGETVFQQACASASSQRTSPSVAGGPGGCLGFIHTPPRAMIRDSVSSSIKTACGCGFPLRSALRGNFRVAFHTGEDLH
jgi:hypothetical protein